LLNQSAQPCVLILTRVMLYQGSSCLSTVSLYKPTIVSAKALSHASPTLPTDDAIPATQVRFTVIGTNSALLGHGFGVDCLELRP